MKIEFTESNVWDQFEIDPELIDTLNIRQRAQAFSGFCRFLATLEGENFLQPDVAKVAETSIGPGADIVIGHSPYVLTLTHLPKDMVHHILSAMLTTLFLGQASPSHVGAIVGVEAVLSVLQSFSKLPQNVLPFVHTVGDLNRQANGREDYPTTADIATNLGLSEIETERSLLDIHTAYPDILLKVGLAWRICL